MGSKVFEVKKPKVVESKEGSTSDVYDYLKDAKTNGEAWNNYFNDKYEKKC